MWFKLMAFILICHTVTSSPIKPKRKPGSGLYNVHQFEHSNMVDGDMIIPKREHHRRERRLISEYKDYDWINATVPYVFDYVIPISDTLYNITLDSFHHISTRTCVKFVERTTEPDYINITAAEQGCFSQVGRFYGMQQLNLATDCDSLEVVVHELLHALGFLHEHNRLDRDDYVYVNFTNLMGYGKSSYTKYNSTAYGPYTIQGLPYDKQSVLHYHRYAFSLYEAQTFLEIKEQMAIYSLSDYQENLGSLFGLSSLDVIRVNARYCGANATALLEELRQSTTTTTTTTTQSGQQQSTDTATNPGTDPATNPGTDPATNPETDPVTNPGTDSTETTTVRQNNNSSSNITNWGIPDNANSHTISFCTALFATLFALMLGVGP